MSALVSPRVRRAWARAVGTSLLVAVIASLWTSVQPAFADGHRLEIQSNTSVGAFSGKALSPAVRLDPPDAVVADAPGTAVSASDAPVVGAPVAPIVNQSNCRSDFAGAAMTITIPSISYVCPVYAGGQTMLNSGAVTQISDDAIASVLADHPGGRGLLWMAAHRSSHGGAFAAVPRLADGALITVSDGTHTATYRIVGRIYVSIVNDRVVDSTGHATGAATLDSIIRPDHGGNGASRLLLQTCDGEDHRWMIYADLVTA